MTIRDILDKVKEVERFKNDPEAAHVTEDRLWKAVLSEIAEGRPKEWCQVAAGVALKTDAIRFERWCA